MNTRSPLYAKILIWFSLNLLLLMVIAWLLLRFAATSGFASFLAGHVGGRVESTARAILADLETKPRTEWNDILKAYGAVHGVKFLLLGSELETLAGEEVDLPESLRMQLPRPPRGAANPNRRGGAPGDFATRNDFGPPGKKSPNPNHRPPVETDW